MYVRTGCFRMPFSLFLAYFFHSPKDCLTNLREGFVRILKKYAVSAYDLAYSPYFRIQNLLASRDKDPAATAAATTIADVSAPIVNHVSDAPQTHRITHFNFL